MIVTLIRPSFVLPVTSHQAQQGVPPLGLAYLAGTIQKGGHSAICIDGPGEKLDQFSQFEVAGLLIQGLSHQEILARIPQQTEIIGVSCMYANEWLYAKKLLAMIKNKFPDKLLIVGGEAVSADTDYILNACHQIDLCVIGEGEETMLDIVKRWSGDRDFSKVPGLAFRNAFGQIQKTLRRARISDIDSIAWPDWSTIPVENYLNQGRGNDTQGKRSLPLLASRGCPYRCAFCTSPQMWTTKWSARCPQDLVNEMKFYIEKYKIEHFEFYDLTVIIKADWIEEFCGLLAKENLPVTWSLPTGTRTEALNLKILSLLKTTGCKKLSLSPESGSATTLKRMHKRLKPENMLKVIKNCAQVGIVTKCNIIFGLPEQTQYEIFENFVFILKMAWAGANDVACFSFVPYPGSELFEKLVTEGKIKKDSNYEIFLSKNIYNDTSELRSWSKHIPDWQMPFLIMGGMASFYFFSFLIRPHRFGLAIYRLVCRKPVTMLEMLISGLCENFIIGRKAQRKLIR